MKPDNGKPVSPNICQYQVTNCILDAYTQKWNIRCEMMKEVEEELKRVDILREYEELTNSEG